MNFNLPKPDFSNKRLWISVATLFLFLSVPLTVYVVLNLREIETPASVPTTQNPQPCGLVGALNTNEVPNLTNSINISKSLETANNEVAEKFKTDTRSDSKRKTALGSLVSQRKQNLIQTMKVCPSKALETVKAASEVREGLVKLFPNDIEQVKKVEGTLEIIHTDLFDKKFSNEEYILNTPDGKKVNIYPSTQPRITLKSGAKVAVQGYQIENNLLFDASSTNSSGSAGGLNVLNSPTVASVGNQRLLVIITKFSDSPLVNTQQEIQNLIDQRVSPYYSENSYNQMNLASTVVGPYTIPKPSLCSFASVFTEGFKVADPYVDYRNFDHVLIVKPATCDIGGVSSGGKTLVSTADGVVNITKGIVTEIIPTDYYTIYAFLHELGHALGTGHSGFEKCDSTFDYDHNPTCHEEYGNIYDVMGRGSGHFASNQKDSSGWLDSNSIREVTTNGVYTIEPLSKNSTGLKAIKVRRVDNNYVYVEYRQPLGFDLFKDGNAFKTDMSGTEIYTGATIVITRGNGGYIIDPTPNPSVNVLSPTLKLNESYTDPLSGTTVKVLRISPESIDVQITIGRTDFTPPTVSIVSPANNATVTGIVPIRAEAEDSSGIEKVEFYGIKTGSSNSLFLLHTDTEFPFEYQWDTSKSLAGTANKQPFYVIATDKSGQPYSVPGLNAISSTVEYVIQRTDFINPTIKLKNSVTYNPALVEIEASDNVGVYVVDIYIAGFDSIGVFDFSAPYKRGPLFLAPGDYRVTASVSDFQGNNVFSHFNLTVKEPPSGSFIGEYFNNEDFTSEKLERNDPKVNFHWGTKSPAPGVDPGSFSVVWSGKFNFDTDTYRFNTQNSGIIKVYIDDFPIPIVSTSERISQKLWDVTSGEHYIKIEYSHSSGQALVILTPVKAYQCYDMNGDKVINSLDMLIISQKFNVKGVTPWDLNKDKVVNSLDQLLLSKKINSTCN